MTESVTEAAFGCGAKRMKKLLKRGDAEHCDDHGTVALTAAPVSADTPRCVTVKQYRQVYKGMKKWRVHRMPGQSAASSARQGFATPLRALDSSPMAYVGTYGLAN